jgi:hypothetical protein
MVKRIHGYYIHTQAIWTTDWEVCEPLAEAGQEGHPELPKE